MRQLTFFDMNDESPRKRLRSHSPSLDKSVDQSRSHSGYGYDSRVAHTLTSACSRSTPIPHSVLESTRTSDYQPDDHITRSLPSKTLPKGAVTATTKKIASNISKWNRKQEEAATTSIADAQIDTPPTALNVGTSQPVTASVITQYEETALQVFDYTDEVQIACLLCQRKFKGIETLHRHVAESQLHVKNLTDRDMCRDAVQRKLAAKREEVSESQSRYRDRASERRAVFGADHGTVKKPAPTVAPTKAASAMRRPWTLLSAEEKPIDNDNVGSKLLSMMGWTPGQGLGTAGQGRVDIVETKIYRAGAGLGSAQAEGDRVDPRARIGVAFSGYRQGGKNRR